ncbi:MAG: hypothetical protein F4X74_02545 [Acidimicrobiia bacterium]|nr:hypothetical protein [Acidimicrobiia bacterium]
MYIERVQVDEGFLDGLDLQLGRGLNVVIGARGSGKTSLIELVRFCLGARAFTEDAADRGYQQARAVLRGGQVTITLTNGVERITTVRSHSDEYPRSTAATPDVTILAQGEIEAVGDQPSGRLYLIDRLRPGRRDLDRRSEQLRAELRSLTTEIRDLLLEIDKMRLAVGESRDVPGELTAALEVEASALQSARATKEDRTRLSSLQHLSAQLKVRRGVFERALQELRSVHSELDRVSNRGVLIENWPESAGKDDLLQPIRVDLTRALGQLTEVRNRIVKAGSSIRDLLQADVRRAVDVDDASREIRSRLGKVDEGVEAATRRVEELRERAGQLAALRQRLNQKHTHALEQVARRDVLYSSLDRLRRERLASRSSIAQSVTDELGPGIQVKVRGSERTRSYASAIALGLRGSGLHYNTLSPHLAAVMPPLELVKAVETREPAAIADAAEISIQRASAIIEALKDEDLGAIVAAPIDDAITLELLDGSVFKKSQEVSIGQRCTIVLPVLLTRHGGILVVDQPEDHLDNSFITSTVVEALRNRHPDDQLLFASHNANIPVLGDADLVVALDSDGKRGFVKHSGPLMDPDSVRAITDVMEGGVDAFRRRAEFYGITTDEE